MNRRQWKKACKRAAERLAREFPGEFVITMAEGDECVDAPAGYEPPFGASRADRRYPDIPRGTPVIWERVSYEYDEWECRTALEIYEQRRAVEDTDWEALASQLERAA